MGSERDDGDRRRRSEEDEASDAASAEEEADPPAVPANVPKAPTRREWDELGADDRTAVIAQMLAFLLGLSARRRD